MVHFDGGKGKLGFVVSLRGEVMWAQGELSQLKTHNQTEVEALVQAVNYVLTEVPALELQYDFV